MTVLPKMRPMPAPNVPLLNSDGTMRPEWRQYFQAIDALVRAMAPAVETL
ncbi:hypothetical protein [Xanthobacter sp. VNH20]